MDEKRLPYLYLAVPILFWSGVPAVAKLALGELNNFQLLFFNCIVAVISLSLAVLLQNKQNYLLKYTKFDYLKMFGMGFLGIYLYYVLLYGSFALVPSGQANMINYLWPTFVVIFSIPVLGDRFNLKTFLAILVSFAGALIVFTRGDFSSFSNEHSFGYLLAAAGAVCYGLFSVLGKKIQYEKYSSMLVYYAASLILITPTVYFTSGLVIPTKITTFLAILFMGGIASSLGFVFWFKALDTGHTHKVANAIYLVPFLALAWVSLLNNETVPLISILGLVLIASGILIQAKN